MIKMEKVTKPWDLCVELSSIMLKYKNDDYDLLGQYDEKTLCLELHRHYLANIVFQSEIKEFIRSLHEQPWESDSSFQRKKLIIESILQKL